MTNEIVGALIQAAALFLVYGIVQLFNSWRERKARRKELCMKIAAQCSRNNYHLQRVEVFYPDILKLFDDGTIPEDSPGNEYARRVQEAIDRRLGRHSEE